MELLAVASRQFAPKIVDPSARFIHSHFLVFFLVSERSGRRKPPAERSALHEQTTPVGTVFRSTAVVPGTAST